MKYQLKTAKAKQNTSCYRYSVVGLWPSIK